MNRTVCVCQTTHQMAALSAHCFRCAADRAMSSENISLCSALPESRLENRQTFRFTRQGTILHRFNFR